MCNDHEATYCAKCGRLLRAADAAYGEDAAICGRCQQRAETAEVDIAPEPVYPEEPERWDGMA